MSLSISAIVSGIENLDEESFKNLWTIAHPKDTNSMNDKWNEFNKLSTYKEKECWLATDKTFLHYVEAYCVGWQKGLN